MNDLNVQEKKTASGFNGSLLYILSLLYGVLFTEFIFRGSCELGALITTALFYLFFLPFVVRKSEKFPLSAWISVVGVVVLALCCAFFAPGPWKIFAVLGILTLQLLQLPKLCGYSAQPLFSFKNFLHGLFNIVITPIESLIGAFKSLGTKTKGKRGSFGVAGKILLGIFISLPLVALLIALFSTADKMFSYFIKYAIDELHLDWGGLIVDIVVGFLISLYVFPWIYGYHTVNPNRTQSTAHFKGIDATILSTVIFACDVVYLLFVFVQFTYLFSPGRKLPAGTTYADYCRGGFFELVFIIIATFALTAFTLLIARKKDNGGTKMAVKLSLTILSLSNVIIVASAFYRLGMYVDAYGLSRSRVIAGWAVVVIALLALTVLFRIWIRRLKITGVAGTIAVIMIIALNLINTDALVARVNISRYLDDGKDLDFYYLSSENLSTAVVPEVMRLYDEGSKEDKEMAKIILSSHYPYLDNSIGAINYQDLAAEKILADNNIKKYKNDEALYDAVTKLIKCPYEYCGEDCRAREDYDYLCKTSCYCTACGKKVCEYCEHDCPEAKEDNYYNQISSYCTKCGSYSHSFGDVCYCQECGKKLSQR